MGQWTLSAATSELKAPCLPDPCSTELSEIPASMAPLRGQRCSSTTEPIREHSVPAPWLGSRVRTGRYLRALTELSGPGPCLCIPGLARARSGVGEWALSERP